MGLLATGIALVALWAPPDPEAVRAALERVLAERPYQTTLPDGRRAEVRDKASEPSATPPSREVTRRRTGYTSDRRDPDSSPRDHGDSSRSSGSGGAGAALFWVVLCVLAAIFVAWLVSEWKGRGRGGDRSTARAYQPPSPTPAMPTIPLDEVDRLAAAGRYGEAIHLLLLRTITGLTGSSASLAPSLTSREILAHVPFRPGARDELAGLVDAVEVSLFGGRAVAPSEYLDCRARFDRFATLQSGGVT